MLSNTMIGMPSEAHHNRVLSLLIQDELHEDLHRVEVSGRLYKIRNADSSRQRNSASNLISRMYASRGYLSSALPDDSQPSRITLVASDHESTVGTISIGVSSDSLQVGTLFPDEVDALRQAGSSVCEFTTLAMDHVVRSSRVLGSLFHVAYIYAHRVMDFDTLLIEVNPRHVRFYERMLGFEVMGQRRHCPRVDAPAVLLGIRLGYIREMVERFGGQSQCSPVERSLYPNFFSPAEEESLVRRLVRSKVSAANTEHHRQARMFHQ